MKTIDEQKKEFCETGSAAIDQGDYITAKNNYLKALEILETKCRNHDGGDYDLDFLEIYVNLAYATYGTHQFRETVDWLDKALALNVLNADGQLQKSGTTDKMNIYFFCCKLYVECYINLKKFSEAEAWCHKGIKTTELLMKKDCSLKGEFKQCFFKRYLGEIAERKGESGKAKTLYLMILDNLESRKEMSDLPQYNELLSAVYNGLGRVTETDGRFINKTLNEALDWFFKSAELREEMVEETNSIENRILLCKTYYEIGYLYTCLEKYETALAWYEDEYDILHLLRNEIDSVEIDTTYATCCYELGRTQFYLGNHNLGIENLKKGIEIITRLSRETDSPVIKNNQENMTEFYLAVLAEQVISS